MLLVCEDVLATNIFRCALFGIAMRSYHIVLCIKLDVGKLPGKLLADCGNGVAPRV